MIHVKAGRRRVWPNAPMDQSEKTMAYRKDCLAYRVGACAAAQCFECGPVHQALRIASVTLARWPRPLPRPPGAQATR